MWVQAPPFPLGIALIVNLIPLMSDQNFCSKFRKSIQTLDRAVKREVILAIDQPKLYKKIVKYFENEGVQFYGEIEADYELILSLISEELQSNVLV